MMDPSSDPGWRERVESERKEEATLQCIKCRKLINVICTDCGTRQSQTNPVAKIAVKKVDNVNLAEHTTLVATQSNCRQNATQGLNTEAASIMVRSRHNGIYIKEVHNLILTQHLTTINVDSTQQDVRVKVAIDPEELQAAADGVLILKTDWGQFWDPDTGVAPSGVTTPSLHDSPSSSSEQPDNKALPPPLSASLSSSLSTSLSPSSTSLTSPPPLQEESVRGRLVTRLIDSETEKLFIGVMHQISWNSGLSARVVQQLYKKFHLRLLGITKRLEFLMDVDARDVATVLQLEPEVQEVLAEVVLEPQRNQLLWEKFSYPFPVQCTEDLEADPVSVMNSSSHSGSPPCRPLPQLSHHGASVSQDTSGFQGNQLSAKQRQDASDEEWPSLDARC